VIRYAVWLYFRFTSIRAVEELLAPPAWQGLNHPA